MELVANSLNVYVNTVQEISYCDDVELAKMQIEKD